VASLADNIERYLKSLLDQAREGMIEIRRAEIAQEFDCVPSQINYVLATRFTPEQGYVVESRRGGGGYIRILRLSWGSPPGLLQQICCSIGSDISQEDAEALLSRLAEIGALSRRQEAMLRASLRMETSMLDPPWDGIMRASLLKAMLMVLFEEN
jgi:transcriptional regulator CtsR